MGQRRRGPAVGVVADQAAAVAQWLVDVTHLLDLAQLLPVTEHAELVAALPDEVSFGRETRVLDIGCGGCGILLALDQGIHPKRKGDTLEAVLRAKDRKKLLKKHKAKRKQHLKKLKERKADREKLRERYKKDKKFREKLDKKRRDRIKKKIKKREKAVKKSRDKRKNFKKRRQNRK